MTYLITQVFAMLLAAALIGLVVGWFLARIGARSARHAYLARVNSLETDLRKRRDELQVLTSTKGGLEAERQALKKEIASLKAALGEGPAGGAPAVGAVDGQAPAPAADGEAADDLRQIKGIGPKIAGILSDIGVRRFDQIAAWTPENVAWVNGYLKFKGRVEREQWIAQARDLVAAREDR